MSRRLLLFVQQATTRLASRALVTTKTAALSASPAGTLVRFSTLTEVPENDYYNGHLLTDHLEYLDDVLEKTIGMEECMQDLNNIRALKKEAIQQSQWHASNIDSVQDIDQLFHQAELKSTAILDYIKALRETAVYHQAQQRLRQQRVFAVDAPDGTCDETAQDEILQVQKLASHAG